MWVDGVYERGGGVVQSRGKKQFRVRRAKKATMNHFREKQKFMGRKS